MLHVCNIKRFPPCCCIDQMLNFTENATHFLYKSHRSCQKHSNFGRETYGIFRKPCYESVDKMKYLEIIPDFLSMYGVFTSQNTSRVRQEMSIILTHLAYIANVKKTCYIVQQFHWANKRDVTLRHL